MPPALHSANGGYGRIQPGASVPGDLREKMMEWEPIETAPRDGTPVDLWHKAGFRVYDVWWDDSDDQEPGWSNLMPENEFSHWLRVEPPQ